MPIYPCAFKIEGHNPTRAATIVSVRTIIPMRSTDRARRPFKPDHTPMPTKCRTLLRRAFTTTCTTSPGRGLDDFVRLSRFRNDRVADHELPASLGLQLSERYDTAGNVYSTSVRGQHMRTQVLKRLLSRFRSSHFVCSEPPMV
ncbi:unnamed protein product [Periconia digitata]|uniref:Uncharacterized protein n=1 Tax=Periconia digitata TaxID=1303443 RepID=A0A9W4UM63_9PLEO|nr:unnamed protein product [Periconia digitata]